MSVQWKFKFLTMVLAVLFAVGCFQETSKNISKVKLPQPISQLSKGFYKPSYIPKSQNILLTDEADAGISLYNIEKQTIVKLTDAVVTDQNILYSPEGTHVFFIEQSFANRKRESSLVMIETGSLKKKYISEKVRDLKLLRASQEDLLFLEEGKMKKYTINDGSAESFRDNEKYYYLDEDLNLAYWHNGEKSIINPSGEEKYLWVSVSPDQQKILYHLAGQGAYICDFEGKEIVELGRLRAVKWSPDGKWLVGMEDQDDGIKFTKSNVFLISPDGKEKKNLTQHTSIIALYPSFSADGRKVIFNDEQGKVYQLEIF